MTASTSPPHPATSGPRPTRWETAADRYDAWFDTPWGAYASSIEHDLLVDGLPPLSGATVLDAGCGTARFMARLETSGADVTGLDQDRAALNIARTRVHGSLVAGDVHQLPFRDHHFDTTFAVTVCEFTDPTTTIAELVRVTRPGGHTVIGSLNPHSPWGWRMRRRFRQPPWNQATFLRRSTLEDIGRRHGTTTWRAGLFAPDALPGYGAWGPALERLGRRLRGSNGAFGVLTITPPDETPPPGTTPAETSGHDLNQETPHP